MKNKVSLGKVFVGLSGGVDSSVSAALLQQAGYNVHGVFIKVWQPDFYECTWKEDRLDAMRVCAKLGIPFTTLDLEKEYKKEVVDYMIREYKMGQTPNPDVMCNKYIKFGGFFNWAMKEGADYVATGHYAQVKKDKKLFKLLAGEDNNKDQTYFLWTLNQKQIAKTLFPIGHIAKPKVRQLAKKFNLPTAEKKDSQGLCFIGKVDMSEFLQHFIKSKVGKVLNDKGDIIGTHKGAVFYTIGQRHGFCLHKNSPNDTRNFVISKDIKKNTLTISNKVESKKADKTAREFILKSINWTLNELPSLNKKYQARIRYRQPVAPCHLILKGKKVTIIFDKIQTAPAKGQSIVIYDEEVCLGGGIIS